MVAIWEYWPSAVKSLIYQQKLETWIFFFFWCEISQVLSIYNFKILQMTYGQTNHICRLDLTRGPPVYNLWSWTWCLGFHCKISVLVLSSLSDSLLTKYLLTTLCSCIFLTLCTLYPLLTKTHLSPNGTFCSGFCSLALTDYSLESYVVHTKVSPVCRGGEDEEGEESGSFV